MKGLLFCYVLVDEDPKHRTLCSKPVADAYFSMSQKHAGYKYLSFHEVKF